jgi:hypothetical protein
MWSLGESNDFEHNRRRYSSANPDAFAAVLTNLERYFRLLHVTTGGKQIEASYLHHTKDDIVIVNQAGLESFGEDFKIYTFADHSTKTLYLLTLAAKADPENADMEYCRNVIYSIKTKNIPRGTAS